MIVGVDRRFVDDINTDHLKFQPIAALAHLGERQTEVQLESLHDVQYFWRHCVRSTEAAFLLVEPYAPGLLLLFLPVCTKRASLNCFCSTCVKTLGVGCCGSLWKAQNFSSQRIVRLSNFSHLHAIFKTRLNSISPTS